MEKKKLLRIFISIILISIILLTFTSNVYAGWEKIFEVGNDGLSTAKSKIFGIIQAVGLTVAIIMLTIIGIKYLWTSPEGKAEVKKQLFPYLIGCILLFSGSILVNIIGNMAQNLIN